MDYLFQGPLPARAAHKPMPDGDPVPGRGVAEASGTAFRRALSGEEDGVGISLPPDAQAGAAIAPVATPSSAVRMAEATPDAPPPERDGTMTAKGAGAGDTFALPPSDQDAAELSVSGAVLAAQLEGATPFDLQPDGEGARAKRAERPPPSGTESAMRSGRIMGAGKPAPPGAGQMLRDPDAPTRPYSAAPVPPVAQVNTPPLSAGHPAPVLVGGERHFAPGDRPGTETFFADAPLKPPEPEAQGHIAPDTGRPVAPVPAGEGRIGALTARHVDPGMAHVPQAPEHGPPVSPALAGEGRRDVLAAGLRNTNEAPVAHSPQTLRDLPSVAEGSAVSTAPVISPRQGGGPLLPPVLAAVAADRGALDAGVAVSPIHGGRCTDRDARMRDVAGLLTPRRLARFDGVSSRTPAARDGMPEIRNASDSAARPGAQSALNAIPVAASPPPRVDVARAPAPGPIATVERVAIELTPVGREPAPVAPPPPSAKATPPPRATVPGQAMLATPALIAPPVAAPGATPPADGIGERTGGDTATGALPVLPPLSNAPLSMASPNAPTHAAGQSHAPLATQVVRAVADLHPDGGTVELTLDPPELGRLRLSMSDGPGPIQLSITVDRPETADLLRRHLDQLQQEFLRAGLEGPTVRLSLDGRGGAARGGSGGNRSDGKEDEVATRDAQGQRDTEPPRAAPRILAATALDLRL